MKIFNKLLYISNKIDRNISFRTRKFKFPDSLYIGYNNIPGTIDNIYFIFVFIQIKSIKFYNIDLNGVEEVLSISDTIKRINFIDHIKRNKQYVANTYIKI